MGCEERDWCPRVLWLHLQRLLSTKQHCSLSYSVSIKVATLVFKPIVSMLYVLSARWQACCACGYFYVALAFFSIAQVVQLLMNYMTTLNKVGQIPPSNTQQKFHHLQSS